MKKESFRIILDSLALASFITWTRHILLATTNNGWIITHFNRYNEMYIELFTCFIICCILIFSILSNLIQYGKKMKEHYQKKLENEP